MTTTELIELLIKNEKGGISHKSREISLTINGKYMPNPQITLSSTGDGVVGPEIDLDIDGEFFEEQEPKTAKAIPIPEGATNGDILKSVFPKLQAAERNNVILEIRERELLFTGMTLREWWDAPYQRGAE